MIVSLDFQGNSSVLRMIDALGGYFKSNGCSIKRPRVDAGEKMDEQAALNLFSYVINPVFAARQQFQERETKA